jgi:hypothetical protein
VPAGGVVTETYHLALTLNADDKLTARDVRATLSDVEALLRELERSISPDRKARATWEWGDLAVGLDLAARPNGASAETLQEVVRTARAGFESAQAAAETATPAVLPGSFDPASEELLRKILGRLKRLTGMTVGATGEAPLEVTAANIGHTVRARRVRRVFSSVDGVLYLIAGGETVVRAGLREHRTRVHVTCTFPADWKPKLRDLWDQRVVIEGMVAYSAEGKPRSLIEPARITPRFPGASLRALEGAAPDLTGDMTDDEYLTMLRRYG